LLVRGEPLLKVGDLPVQVGKRRAVSRSPGV